MSKSSQIKTESNASCPNEEVILLCRAVFRNRGTGWGKWGGGSEKLVQGFRVLIALVEDPSSIPSANKVAHDHV